MAQIDPKLLHEEHCRVTVSIHAGKDSCYVFVRQTFGLSRASEFMVIEPPKDEVSHA